METPSDDEIAAITQMTSKLAATLSDNINRWFDECELVEIGDEYIGGMVMEALTDTVARGIAYMVKPEKRTEVAGLFSTKLSEAVEHFAKEADQVLRQKHTVDGMKARLAATIRRAGRGNVD